MTVRLTEEERRQWHLEMDRLLRCESAAKLAIRLLEENGLPVEARQVREAMQGQTGDK